MDLSTIDFQEVIEQVRLVWAKAVSENLRRSKQGPWAQRSRKAHIFQTLIAMKIIEDGQVTAYQPNPIVKFVPNEEEQVLVDIVEMFMGPL